MSRSTVDISLEKFRFTCSVDDVADTFAWLLVEMRAAVPRLRTDERIVLRTIMAHESKALTVRDLFPDFVRNSEAHKTLRRLRAGQFVRPALSGHWVLDEPIEVKPFGRLIWVKCGEEALFGDVAVASAEGKPESSEIDLSRPYPGTNMAEVALQMEEVADCDYDLIDLLKCAQGEADGPMER